MNERQIELARQIVTCKHWRWMPGMRWIAERPQPIGNVYGRIFEISDGCSHPAYVWAIPNLDDPATIGCLLALVREVCGPLVWIRLWRDIAPRMEGDRGGCEIVDGVGRSLFAGPRVLYPTEGEALAAALLGAP